MKNCIYLAGQRSSDIAVNKVNHWLLQMNSYIKNIQINLNGEYLPRLSLSRFASYGLGQGGLFNYLISI